MRKLSIYRKQDNGEFEALGIFAYGGSGITRKGAVARKYFELHPEIKLEDQHLYYMALSVRVAPGKREESDKEQMVQFIDQ